MATAPAGLMASRERGLADDFIGVPAEEWWRVRETVRDLSVLSLLLFAVLAILVIILLRKGVISLADLRLSDG